MSQSLKWNVDAAAAMVRLEGVFDEHAKVEQIAQEISMPRFSFDLGGIRRMNSLGIRRWIQLLGLLKGRQILLRRCPPAVVDQLNAIKGFAAGAAVDSVLLPYTCDHCSTTTYHELQLARMQSLSQVAEVANCSKCGGEASFDDILERYLAFVAHKA